jgi:hypothetical protein
MLKTIIAVVLATVALSACVVYPAHPAYYRAPAVVY